MRQLPNWIVWKLEYPNGLDKKPTKRPYQITGKPASVTDPNHWVTFEDAFKRSSGYTGLGFCFSKSPYSGIDLDDASKLADGSDNPNYKDDLSRQIKIATDFDSYSETSPSGKGLHIIVKGKVPDGKRTNYIELYPEARYFTMTGNVFNNKPIADRQDALNQLWAQMGGVIEAPATVDSPLEISDDQILELARKHNTSTFTDLEAGQWVGKYPSQSEADQAYLNIIAYYTNDRLQVERIFRASKLMRSKVNINKGYLKNSITKAFDQKVPPLNFDGLKEQLELKLSTKPASYNGSTVAFDATGVGSIPSAGANTPITLPPGLLGEVAQFIYAAAPRPVQEVAIAAAIGLLSGITGRAYNVSGTGLNQYVLLLAMTGAGKEASTSGINKLMGLVKEQVPSSINFVGPSEIASGAALFKFLGTTSQSFISFLGEFGLRLQQMSSPNANGSEVSLRRMLLDLYNKSGASEILHASIYSDKANNTSAVHSPSFSILGDSTPERFYGALNEDMISEGLLPRFLLIEYKGNRPDLNDHHTQAVPSFNLIKKLSDLAAYVDSLNHAAKRLVINVQSTPEAAKSLREFDLSATNKINSSNKEVIRQLWNRAHIKVLKLSALLAVGQNMIEPVITQVDFEWAARLIEADINAITDRFDAGEIGGNSFELNQMKDMIRIIKEYVDKDFEYVSKYKAVEKMHKNKVISNTYLNLRLTKMASFRNDRIGGTGALKRTIQNMIDNGRLITLSSVELFKKYETTQKAYYIHPSILED